MRYVYKLFYFLSIFQAKLITHLNQAKLMVFTFSTCVQPCKKLFYFMVGLHENGDAS